MEDYLERLQQEKDQLDEQIKRFDAFLLSEEYQNNVSIGEQDLMIKQREAMIGYLDIITDRLALNM
jgi:membrane glycosyltransferase